MEDNNSIYKFCCSYFFVGKDNFKITENVDVKMEIEYRFDKILREFKEKIKEEDSLIMYQFNLFDDRYGNWLGVCNIFGEEVEMIEGKDYNEEVDCEYCLLKEIVREEFKYDENFVVCNI